MNRNINVRYEVVDGPKLYLFNLARFIILFYRLNLQFILLGIDLVVTEKLAKYSECWGCWNIEPQTMKLFRTNGCANIGVLLVSSKEILSSLREKYICVSWKDQRVFNVVDVFGASGGCVGVMKAYICVENVNIVSIDRWTRKQRYNYYKNKRYGSRYV